MGGDVVQLSWIPIIAREELQDAWKWLLETMSLRPVTPDHTFIYDQKQWQHQDQYEPLKANDVTIKRLGILFLTSELGTDEEIHKLVNYGKGFQVDVLVNSLDRDVSNVVKEIKGFRDSLSEHLAFWVRLACAAQMNVNGQNFACSLPNVQSRDKGPDGLFVATGEADFVEIQSVKNSIGNPRGLVATRRFREQGRIHKRDNPKQLEEFWLTSNENWGIVRLQRTLSNLCRLLEVTDQHLFKMSLSKDLCFYNAVVVANQEYAKPDVFEGYQHIVNDVERRIATYISSDNWKEVAEKTRKDVQTKLRQAKLI